MIDPTRMERIWAKEPALRPEGLECPIHGHDPCWVLKMQGARWFPIEQPIAAALIRDTCVWWLAENYYAAPGRSSTGIWGLIRYDLGAGVCYSLGDSTDPTEAVLLAVEAVLGLPAWNPQPTT